jgi:hypothetical protein
MDLSCAAIRRFALSAILPLVLNFALSAQPSASDVTPDPKSGLGDDRILGVIPNYQTVNDPRSQVVPLTVKQKWRLFAKETFDPFTGVSAAIGSAFAQSGNGDPRYGHGGKAYAERFGAAVTDFATQNLFSDAILASLLHQDPRYFRKGPQSRILARVGYAVSRMVVTRQDSGRAAFNFSGVIGMSLGIAASNLYYPRASVNGSVAGSRFGTSMMSGAIGNLLSEFWPDIRAKVFRHREP